MMDYLFYLYNFKFMSIGLSLKQRFSVKYLIGFIWFDFNQQIIGLFRCRPEFEFSIKQPTVAVIKQSCDKRDWSYLGHRFIFTNPNHCMCFVCTDIIQHRFSLFRVNSVLKSAATLVPSQHKPILCDWLCEKLYIETFQEVLIWSFNLTKPLYFVSNSNPVATL